MKKRSLLAKLVGAPYIVWSAIFIVVPLLMIVYYSFTDKNGEPFMPPYAYDPRLVKVEDTYYIMWCQDAYGPTIGIARTLDFKRFERIENPYLPYNRNAVLFPRKINGNYDVTAMSWGAPTTGGKA